MQRTIKSASSHMVWGLWIGYFCFAAYVIVVEHSYFPDTPFPTLLLYALTGVIFAAVISLPSVIIGVIGYRKIEGLRQAAAAGMTAKQPVSYFLLD